MVGADFGLDHARRAGPCVTQSSIEIVGHARNRVFMICGRAAIAHHTTGGDEVPYAPAGRTQALVVTCARRFQTSGLIQWTPGEGTVPLSAISIGLSAIQDPRRDRTARAQGN